MRRVSLVALFLLTLLPACTDDGSSSGDDGTDSGGDPSFNAHCQAQADWDPAWAAFEDQVLTLANQYRAQGATCGSDTFGPTGPLAAEPQLRCAARLHSMDMLERDFFDHTNPDGLSPWDRVDLTDYTGSAIGENIAWGQSSPEQVMDSWMNSPGHCSNIMNPEATELGVGYYDGNYWTQVMGRR